MADPWKEKRVIGNATLYLGDCLEILPHLPKMDAVITDPPYNAKNIGPDHKVYENQRMQLPLEEYKEFCARWFSESRLKSDRIIFTSGISNVCFYPQPDWIICWHKPAAVSFNRMGGFNAWEPILIYGKPAKQIGQDYWLCNTLNLVKDHDHPCPKPLALIIKKVDYFSAENETVLDPFTGSGTTGIACMNLGRKFIGIEIEPKYFEIACERIENAQRQLRMFA